MFRQHHGTASLTGLHTHAWVLLLPLQAYFDHHATVIQKCWRGHHSRAHVHDFYKRKAFLQSVAAANAAVKADMEAGLQAALQHQQQEAQAAAKHHFDTQVCQVVVMVLTVNLTSTAWHHDHL